MFTENRIIIGYGKGHEIEVSGTDERSMPEGPSIVILREAIEPFKGLKITAASGYAKIDLERLEGQKILDIKSWGKHCLICFRGFFIRIHLMMFGSYRINERKESNPTLRLQFGKKKEINFYTCNVKLVEGRAEDVYDWEKDIMSDEWNAAKAEKAMKNQQEVQVCDVLLNQDIFSGSGNIIKNEVLFRAKVHPASRIGEIPAKKIKELVKTTRNYSFDFYKWKKALTLAKHWLIYEKRTCPRCDIPVNKDHLGKNRRLTFFCNNCQILFQK